MSCACPTEQAEAPRLNRTAVVAVIALLVILPAALTVGSIL